MPESSWDCSESNVSARKLLWLQWRRFPAEDGPAEKCNPQMKKCVSTKEIVLQMPKVENRVRIFWIFREMVIGALVGVLVVPDEHRREEYDWPCGSHWMVTE